MTARAAPASDGMEIGGNRPGPGCRSGGPTGGAAQRLVAAVVPARTRRAEPASTPSGVGSLTTCPTSPLKSTLEKGVVASSSDDHRSDPLEGGLVRRGHR